MEFFANLKKLETSVIFYLILQNILLYFLRNIFGKFHCNSLGYFPGIRRAFPMHFFRNIHLKFLEFSLKLFWKFSLEISEIFPGNFRNFSLEISGTLGYSRKFDIFFKFCEFPWTSVSQFFSKFFFPPVDSVSTNCN